MTERVFIDTNVWVYAVDYRDTEKQRRARAVIGATDVVLVTSAQVIGELYVALRRMARATETKDVEEDFIHQLGRLPSVPLDGALAYSAIAASREWQISYWDALIIRAAEAAGCSKVLSEDLAAGRVYGSVLVQNPFAP